MQRTGGRVGRSPPYRRQRFSIRKVAALHFILDSAFFSIRLSRGVSRFRVSSAPPTSSPIKGYGWLAPLSEESKVTLLEHMSEGWRPLVDAFRNEQVEFGFPLFHIQTVFEELGIAMSC